MHKIPRHECQMREKWVSPRAPAFESGASQGDRRTAPRWRWKNVQIVGWLSVERKKRKLAKKYKPCLFENTFRVRRRRGERRLALPQRSAARRGTHTLTSVNFQHAAVWSFKGPQFGSNVIFQEKCSPFTVYNNFHGLFSKQTKAAQRR